MDIPRVVISAPKGKSGKTLVVSAILLGLVRRGFKVAPFKVGPDYIDPTYHAAAAGVPSRNLDVFLMGEKGVLERFVRYSAGADIAIIEGVMGLYDSFDAISEVGSTAQVARLLNAPVVLVVDVERMNRSVRALIRGFKLFDPRVDIRGVIITNATGRQIDRLSRVIQEEGVELLGAIPRNSELAGEFAYRHLGLVPVPERGAGFISKLERYVLRYIDVDGIVEVAKSAGPVDQVVLREAPLSAVSRCRVAVVFGGAFTFYYPEVIEAAASLGDVVFLDASRDSEVPSDVDLVVVGGGFPEVLGEDLERNRSFRASLRRFIDGGGRVYAECGGLMYMLSSVIYEGVEYEMVGAVDGVAYVLKKPVGLGYVIGEFIDDSIVAKRGTVIRGHEFHYSKAYVRDDVKLVIRLSRGVGIGNGFDGLVKNNLHAQYTHIHPYTYNVIEAVCRST